MKVNSKHFLLLLGFFINFAWSSKLGTVFSPLVRKSDRYNTQSYSKDMIKVMLNVIIDGGFDAITTYGVGAPNKPYSNTALSESSSFIHTARAVAEINKDRNSLALTLYQGIFNSTYEDQVNCEIELSLETAREANIIYDGSVSGIIYPSTVQFNELIDNGYLNKMIKLVSPRVRKGLNLKFGVRVMDCQNIPVRWWEKVKDVVDNMDFIICSISPDESKFKFGYSDFKNYVLPIILLADDYLQNMNSSTEIILETGWPGSSLLKSPNSVSDEENFWQDIMNWAKSTNTTVFLSEAFDSPWKAEHAEWPLAAYFGRWKYNEDEDDLLSKNAYTLKQDITPSFLSTIVSNYGLTLLGIIAGVLALVVVVIVVVLLFKRVMQIEKATALLSEQDVSIFLNGLTEEDDGIGYKGNDNEWERTPYDKELELNKSRLKIDKSRSGSLGQGQFGCVYRAQYFINNDEEMSVEVAVKMSRSQCSSQNEIKSILSEIKILTYVGSHEHICAIVGAYTEELSKGIVYLAIEFCSMGSLEQCLRKNQEAFRLDLMGRTGRNTYVSSENPLEVFHLSDYQLLRWCHEICQAMEFISSKNVIHSDLATRNVLLTSEYSTKLTDFGLSRLLMEEEDLYSKRGSEPLPWKWLSPESLEFRLFSTKSDVWSYGITVWEIFCIGSSPKYEGVRNWNDLLQALKEGKRLTKPEFAPDSIYAALLECWNLESGYRPSFSQLSTLLVEIISGEYTDLRL